MRKQTVVAVWYRPIKLLTIKSVESIRMSLNRIPGIRLNTIKTPVALMNEMPALQIVKTSFYANAKIRVNANSMLEKVHMDSIFMQQSLFTKELIEERKEAVRRKIEDKYNHYKSKEQL